ncbi:MAG: hypothetical protein AAFN93_21260 [Bacteroidota bacterium]
MIITDYVCCKTCEEKYFLRVGVGLEKYQVHSFDCVSCNLPISVAIRSLTPPNAKFEGVENVVFLEKTVTSIKHSEEDGTIINLHPLFAFTKDEIHSRIAFPSLPYVAKITKHLRFLPRTRFQDVERQFNIPNANNLWGTVKNLILLENNNGKRKVINKLIKHYEDQRRIYIPDTQVFSAKEVALNFFDNLFYPRLDQITRPAVEFIALIKQRYPDAFQKFLLFYSENLHQQHLTQYILTFSDYFKIYTQLSQIVVHARLGDEEVDDKIVGSKCFEDVKLYYGQAYEVLTSVFVILACLNNINSGREYDQFERMTLNKYIKDVSKEKKANPFINIQPFSVYTEGLDSTLRNGSHHASIWRDGEKVFYRSGGTGMQREMPFSRYLHLCNKLTISLASIFMIELELRDD